MIAIQVPKIIEKWALENAQQTVHLRLDMINTGEQAIDDIKMGNIAEACFNIAYPLAKRVNKSTHDFENCGYTIDVKCTRLKKGLIKPYHRWLLPTKAEKRKPQYYAFCIQTHKIIYLCGHISSKDFYEKCVLCKKGEPYTIRGKWVCKEDLNKIEMRQLNPFKQQRIDQFQAEKIFKTLDGYY